MPVHLSSAFVIRHSSLDLTDLLHHAVVIDADLGFRAAGEVAHHRLVAGFAQLADFILGIELEVVVRVEIPLAVAIDADRVDPAAVPIADDRDIACLAEMGLDVADAPFAVPLTSRCQTPLRNTPIVFTPLPVQSPTTGTSPGWPNWKT